MTCLVKTSRTEEISKCGQAAVVNPSPAVAGSAAAMIPSPAVHCGAAPVNAYSAVDCCAAGASQCR